MNTDGKIYIIITDQLPAGNQPTPVPAPSVANQTNGGSRAAEKDQNGIFAHWARQRILSTAKHLATSAVTYSLNNIGNFTGDYITQRGELEGIALLRSMTGIGASALAGFKVGGPWGAVIGATMSVINNTVSSAMHVHSTAVQIAKTNYDIEQLRKRSGLNAAYDGSRGTEN